MEEQNKSSKIKEFISKYKWQIFAFLSLGVAFYFFYQGASKGMIGIAPKYEKYEVLPRTSGLVAPIQTQEFPSYKPSRSFLSKLPSLSETQKAIEQPSIVGEHRIKEGDVNIKSQNADQDYEKIKNSLSTYKGILEKYEKDEDDYKVKIYLNLKIPQDTFDNYIDYLNKNFKVIKSNIRFYILSLKKTYDEVEILKKTFDTLTEYETRLASSYPSRENIELLVYINEKKMNILRQMKNYEREIEETITAENYNKLSISLEQSKKIKILDEEWSNRLRSQLKIMLQNTTDSLLSFLNIIPFLINVLLYLIYAVIIVLALSIVYKFFLIIKKLFNF